MNSARILRLVIALVFFGATAHAQPFSFTFDWSDLKLCTSGSPNRVANPTFVIKGLPKGTVGVYFRLTDKNAPDYNHGGGWAKITKDGTITPGAFKYQSPCPPGGSHLYEWTADARTVEQGQSLSRATSSRNYP